MWFCIYKNGKVLKEYNEDGTPNGRPVKDGNNGKLAVVGEEEYGHKIAVDLTNGIVAMEYDSIGVQNGSLELVNPKVMFWICDETNIIGEFKHLKQDFVQWIDEEGNEPKHEDGSPVLVRNDYLKPLKWRPIWFTRYTMGIPTKVIGAQTRLPAVQGGGNRKKLISLFEDGRIGID